MSKAYSCDLCGTFGNSAGWVHFTYAGREIDICPTSAEKGYAYADKVIPAVKLLFDYLDALSEAQLGPWLE